MPNNKKYDISPDPLDFGQGAYGKVPGNIKLPPSVYQQINAAAPENASVLKSSLTNIGDMVGGGLPTSVRKQIMDSAAAYNVSSGMPSGGFGANNMLRSLGVNALGVMQQGIQDYIGIYGMLGNSMLSPELMSNIASYNSTLNAAPDPAMAAQRLQSLASGGGMPMPSFSPPSLGAMSFPSLSAQSSTSSPASWAGTAAGDYTGTLNPWDNYNANFGASWMSNAPDPWAGGSMQVLMPDGSVDYGGDDLSQLGVYDELPEY